MSKTTRLIVLLMLVLAPLSIGLKISKPLWIHEQHDIAVSPELEAFLAANGLQFFNNYKTINSEAYRVSLYRLAAASRCLGMLYVMPMAVNAEAEFILARPLGVKAADFFYVFDGQIVDHYPSARQWLRFSFNRLRELTGLPTKNAVVYGIATSADCLEPRGFSWHQLKL